VLDDKAMLVDGAVDDEMVGQTSAENSLARALGSPNGRHQRSAYAHDDSPTQKAQVRSRSHDGSARHHERRDQDQQQMAAMNAANSSIGHDRAAAIRRLGNDGGRARRVRIHHSEQQLRARIRRTIRAQLNLNFAWRRSLPGFVDFGRSQKAAAFFELLVLPLSQRPCAR
jgi:hypothetical protein